jgi:hypothetical protein
MLTDDEVPGKGRLPPPFSVPDLFVTSYFRGTVNSLAHFLSIVSEKRADVQTSIMRTKMLDFKEKYEAYCFSNHYTERVIREHKQLFFAKGIQLSTQSDSTTEVFKHIRYKTMRERKSETEPTQLPGEDSLNFFMRTRCIVTPFDAEVIFVKDFIADYDKFNRVYGVQNPAPVTKRAMLSLGVPYERQTIDVLKTDANCPFTLTLDKADKVISNPNRNPFVAKWYLVDLASVFMHMVVIAVMLVPIPAWLIY